MVRGRNEGGKGSNGEWGGGGEVKRKVDVMGGQEEGKERKEAQGR